MYRDLWLNVVAAVDRALRAVPADGRRRPKYSDRLIVLMLLWAAWHDRCLSWACDRGHYGALFRPRALPSISRFTRRAKGRVVCPWPPAGAGGGRPPLRRGARLPRRPSSVPWPPR